MSLDVYLTGPTKSKRSGSGIFIRENGSQREITREEWDERNPGREPVTLTDDDDEDRTIYSANITHNLNEMAKEAGIYRHLWRPEEIGITKAAQLIDPLSAGLKLLLSDRPRFEALNPENGWGDYDGLVSFVDEYMRACMEHPDAEVSVWR